MSAEFSFADHQHMARALQLAERGRYSTRPNPCVGALLVKAGEVVGEGYHYRAGEPHAEIHALRQAGAEAAGADLYVTLEPCSHRGRTPPCCEAVAAAGIKRVVMAMQDPNPLVAGRGAAYLRDAGVVVQSGLMQADAEALNPGFIQRMRQQRPWVRVKMAMSLDGRTAMASGESQWITGASARSDVQKLRARSGAILTGIGTVLADDPALTLRPQQLSLDNAEEICRHQPLRVVLDRQAGLPAAAKLIHQPGRVLWATQVPVESPAANVDTLLLSEAQFWPELMAELCQRQVNELLVEAGATLSGALLRARLVDELVIYLAPKLMGNLARGLFALPFNTMSEQLELKIDEVRSLGEDLRIRARPVFAAAGS